MKERLKRAAHRARANPVLAHTAKSIKPDRSIWGILGVLIFFIIPEIVGFVYGKEIAVWAHANYTTEADSIKSTIYLLLEKIFEDGGSWLNLSIGIALLLWIVLDKEERAE